MNDKTNSFPESPQFPELSLDALFSQQAAYQYVVARRTVGQRRKRLRQLHDAILKRRTAIQEAMWSDFRKNPTEVDISETSFVLVEIRHAIRRLRQWMAPQSAPTPIALIGTRSEIRMDPKGVCLILSPWNFPFNLTLGPLVSAVAAGNCVIIKPSEYTPASSALMKEIIEEVFPSEEVVLVEGDVSVAQKLLSLPFNHIFFTGSPAVGKLVMKAAAEHLASVTLELGGKSPVIIDETANLDVAAERLAWFSGFNASQICIAPDYVFVHESVHDRLVEKIGEKLRKFYGNTPQAIEENPEYPRLISAKHFDRVEHLLVDAVEKGAQIRFGGNRNRETRYLEPTVLTQVPDEAAIWKEEIFGPVLPLRSYRDLQEVIAYVNNDERPLSLYIFSKNKKNINKILRETRNGGVTVNDIAVHFYSPELPFGGVNNSGIGKSHGRFGFLEFTNQRTVVYQNRIFPHTSLFLPPYRMNFLKKWMMEGLMRWF